MSNTIDLAHLTALAEAEFKDLGITDEMYNAVINYLKNTGALTYCGSADGCTKSCKAGQTCGRHYLGNCLCMKEP